MFHNIINAFVFSVLFFRHSFEYLLNFRSTVPNLSIALCLSQLLSTVSEKGGNPAAYREQTGWANTMPHFNSLELFSKSV